MIKKCLLSVALLLALQFNFGEAVEKINELSDVLRNGVEAARNDLDTALVSFISISQNVINNGQATINNFLSGATDQIKSTREEAVGLNDTVNKCIIEKEQQIQSISKNITDIIRTCVMKHVEMAEGIVQGIFKNIEKSPELAEDLRLEYSKCSRAIAPRSCYSRIDANAALRRVKAPLSIKVQIMFAIKSITTLTTDVQICGTVESFGSGYKIPKITNEIAQCVAK